MGLVGLVLVPVASQRSVDYSSTFDFAMRPRQWIALMSQNKATISFSPPFGYELCARNPQVSTVITGASRPGQVVENLGALAVLDRMDQEVLAQIDAALAG